MGLEDIIMDRDGWDYDDLDEDTGDYNEDYFGDYCAGCSSLVGEREYKSVQKRQKKGE